MKMESNPGLHLGDLLEQGDGAFFGGIMTYLDKRHWGVLDAALTNTSCRPLWLAALSRATIDLGGDPCNGNFTARSYDSMLRWIVRRRLRFRRLCVRPDSSNFFTPELVRDIRRDCGLKELDIELGLDGAFTDDTLVALAPLCGGVHALKFSLPAAQDPAFELPPFHHHRAPPPPPPVVTERGVEALLRGCPRLRSVDLTFRRHTADAVATLWTCCPALEDVTIRGDIRRQPMCLQMASVPGGLPRQLRRLALYLAWDDTISMKGFTGHHGVPPLLSALAQQCPALEDLTLHAVYSYALDFRGTGLVTKEHMEALFAGCPRLSRISMPHKTHDSFFSFSTLATVAGVQGLTALTFRGSDETAHPYDPLVVDTSHLMQALVGSRLRELCLDVTDPTQVLFLPSYDALRALTIRDSWIYDKHLRALAVCTSLSSLRVENCQNVKGTFLLPLTKVNCYFEELAVFRAEISEERNRRVTDEKLATALRRCTRLTKVTLDQVSDTVITALAQSCPLLRHVGSHAYGMCATELDNPITDASLAALSTALWYLETLELDNTLCTDQGLQWLATGRCARRLRGVYIDNVVGTTEAIPDVNPMTPSGWRALVECCPSLTHIRAPHPRLWHDKAVAPAARTLALLLRDRGVLADHHGPEAPDMLNRHLQ